MFGPRCGEICPEVDYEAQWDEVAILGSESCPSLFNIDVSQLG